MKFTFKTAALLSILFAGSLELGAQTLENNSELKEKKRIRKGIRVSGGIEGFTTVGENTRSLYEGGYGISIQTEIPLFHNDKFFLTSNNSFGVMYAKEDAAGKTIIGDVKRFSYKVGLRYFPVSNFYLQGEMGSSMLVNKSKFDNPKSYAFTFAPRVGYLLNFGGPGSLDINVRYEQTGAHYSSGKSTKYLGFNIGYAYRF